MKRFSMAVAVAVFAAMALTAVKPHGWSPICAAYTPSDVEWYLFFCYLDPPEKDPRT